MKVLIKNSVLLILLLMVKANAFSQRICEETKERVNLSNGISVDIYQERGDGTYYYVPNQLQLAIQNGKPEISFQAYKDHENATVSGALLHMLITWGLSPTQLDELRQCVKNKHGENVMVNGALMMEPVSETISFSNTPLGNILKEALTSRGSLPTLSNSKMALAFHIKNNDVMTVQNAIKQAYKFKGTTIVFDYKFNSYTCNSGISTIKNNSLKLTGELQTWF